MGNNAIPGGYPSEAPPTYQAFPNSFPNSTPSAPPPENSGSGHPQAQYQYQQTYAPPQPAPQPYTYVPPQPAPQAYAPPPPVQVRVEQVTRPNFSWLAAIGTSAVTFVVSCLLDFPHPLPLAISLIAGAIFGFLATQEPTAQVVSHRTNIVTHGFFATYITPVFSQRLVIRDWTQQFSSFLNILMTLGAIRAANRRDQNTTHVHQYHHERRSRWPF